MTDTTVSPRLHRSATDTVVAGVCGGLAEYLEVEPSLVRLLFVVGTLWGGLGLLIYVILAVVLPVETEVQPRVFHRRERSRNLAGGLLVVLGAVLLAGNLGWAPWLTWNLFWPGVLILVGAALLMRGSSQEAST
jgi:phage shock protein C